jgi:small subunit ribosomal protein S17
METNKHYKAHDAANVCNEGDTVRIVESKPISGGKRWALAEVVEKAK